MQEIIDVVSKKIKNLDGNSKVLVVYHFDVDGCVSASILWRIFQNMKLNADYVPSTRGFEKNVIEEIKNGDYNNIVLLDYVPGNELITELKNHSCLIIDHHQHEKELEIFDYITTSDMGSDVSTSYTLSKVAAEFKVKDVSWLGFLGAFWDKCLEKTEFYKEGIYRDKMDQMLPFNLLVNQTHTRGSAELFDVLNSSENLEGALERINESERYAVAKKIFEEEIHRMVKSRKKYGNNGLSIYFIKTRFKHIRVYVDYITFTEKGTFVFVLDEKTRFKFSFRTTEKINLIEIVKNLKEKFPEFSGGGHIYACGGLLSNTDSDKLIEEFIKEYEKLN